MEIDAVTELVTERDEKKDIKTRKTRFRSSLLKPLKLLLLEVPLQQPLEGLAVSRFAAGHFMYGVIVGLRPTSEQAS